MNSPTSTGLTPIAEASRFIFDAISAVREVEAIPLLDAKGRVLAEDCKAGIDVPPLANSAMDGFAERAADLQSVPISLPVTQRIAAGHWGTELEPGHAARIFTGAPLPPGADAVVMQENCDILDQAVHIKEGVKSGDHVRQAGEDIARGSLLFAKGHRLRPQDIGLLASIGKTRVSVSRQLRIAIMTTGDELVEPGRPLQPGQIYNSNYFSLTSLLENLKVEVRNLGVVEDDFETTRKALLEAAREMDCIISTGGVSVGEADYVRSAVEAEGQLQLWKLAIKPGKPLAFGKVRDAHFFGLPGNPVSAFVTFLLLVRPTLLKLAGCNDLQVHHYPLPADFEAPQSGVRQEYIRVSLHYSNGSPCLQPFRSQSSGVGASLSGAHGLAIIPPHTAINRGDLLHYIPFNELLD
ncbi:MAG: molybdopterin molybdotransferase MoeA [Gammaproteobacteria bacterium]